MVFSRPLASFYDSLNNCIKNCLAETQQPIGTLANLWSAAQSIDQRWQQREAEKKGHSTILAPQGASMSNPNTMQVDAMHQGNSNKLKEVEKDRGSYIKAYAREVLWLWVYGPYKEGWKPQTQHVQPLWQDRSQVAHLLYQIHQETSKWSQSSGNQ
jgi:hypothetical protein